MRRAATLLSCAAVLSCAGALAGCGAGTPVEGRIPGTTLRIYMSGPLHGGSSTVAQAAMNGAQIALTEAHGRLGRLRIVLSDLDDSTPQSDGWDPSQTTLDARRAALDPTTVGYIGDFDSGASAVSIPILNHAGIAQVSPASAAVGLTSSGSGASPGEPEKYYPTGGRTFVRLVPSFAVQAAAEVRVEQELGCSSPIVLQDGEVDGEDAAISYVLAAQAAGIHVLAVQSYERRLPSYASLATSIARSGAGCLLLDGTDEASAARVAAAVAQALPHDTILVSSTLADSAFVDPADGGLPLAFDDRALVFSPALPASLYPPSGRAFLARYTRLYGPPEPSAIFGYTAMMLMLRAIADATDHGHQQAVRAKVVAALLATRRWQSPLGSLTVEPDGSVTIHSYAVDRITRGRLAFWIRLG